eukprot:3400720-Rhodomonas_salina.3
MELRLPVPETAFSSFSSLSQCHHYFTPPLSHLTCALASATTEDPCISSSQQLHGDVLDMDDYADALLPLQQRRTDGKGGPQRMPLTQARSALQSLVQARRLL